MTKKDFLQFLENTKDPLKMGCPGRCCLAFQLQDPYAASKLEELYIAVSGAEAEIYSQKDTAAVIKLLKIMQKDE